MKKSVASSSWIILVVLVLIYTGSYFVMPSAGDLLSPIVAAVSGGILLMVYLLSDKKPVLSLAFIFLSVACFAWSVGDIGWAVLLRNGIDPSQNISVNIAYFVTNIMIVAAVLLFGFQQFHKWRSIRGVIESVTIGILSVLLIWIVFFGKEDAAIKIFTSDGIISAVSIVLDIFLVIEISTWLITAPHYKLPLFLKMIAIGVVLFCATDILYYYLVYKNLYQPNSFIDVLFIYPIALIALGSFHKLISKTSVKDLEGIEDDAGKSKWYFLMIFPVLAVAFEGLNMIDLLVFMGIIVLNHATVKYVHLAYENERLLNQEFCLNAKLEKKIQEQLLELSVLANQDTVTKLYNRRYFSICLEEAIRLQHSSERIIVMQFDLDRFKTINDSYGHDVGDKVIIEISERLLNWNKYDAVLARMGGDEFAILLRGLYTRQQLAGLCRQIVEICSAPIFVDKQVIYVTISIGVSLLPDDAADATTLLKNSDMSMYRAKALGFNKYEFFDPKFKENLRMKNEVEALLRKANLQKDFELFFQPQFEMPEKKLIGAEALLRWNSSEHGYIPPSIFVPVAEEIDYINRIGKWVLRKAVEQVVEWNTHFGVQMKMGINISPKQLTEDDFFLTLKDIIASNDLKAAWIDAEITENLMIEENAKVKPIFDLFEELNISVSIDDFGSGYSSLGYLNKYRFDRIKIDKSLIDNLTVSGGSGLEVVKAIISMANAVGKVTIAEGVETAEQLSILTELGCRQVQGYLLGRPVPADEFRRRYLQEERVIPFEDLFSKSS
ncbi:EAL domain-containing protein [Oscillospiraceae bacterium WX1]